MAFDAREAVATDEEYPPFEFVGLDGDTYHLPNVLTLTFRQAEQLEEDPAGVLADLAPEAYEAMADLPLHAWVKFAEEWREHGGDLGKSPSASRATRRAAARSKRT